jgi:hypothetical protein
MARSISKSRRYTVQYTVAGLWEHERSRLLREIERGDPRAHPEYAPKWSDAERKRANDAAAEGPRRALAAMDADGWTQAMAPSLREFPDAAAVPWLADRSVRCVRVYDDDHIEPA